MNAEIISVGTELLLGDILNEDSRFLSQELAAYGIQLLYQSTVGDNVARLGEMLSLAMGRSDLIILTGGLGPTPDDVTRETVADALSLPLELHEDSWRRIQEYFRITGREMTANNQKQAMLPRGSVVFPNDHGTAPGCAVERYGQSIIMLPGPPRELIPMFNDYVGPYLSKFSGGTIFSRTVGVFGLPESAVAERLADLLSGANPTVAPYVKEGEVTLRVTARAADLNAAQAMCAPVVEEIRRRLGVNVYGVDAGSLQKTVVSLLRQKGLKIATAESCTAGLLSGRITEIPGASSVFECGIAAYSWEMKRDILGVPGELLEQYGAVSAPVAGAMASGARRAGKSALGVAITGEAGPESGEGQPVGTVFIALADEKRVWVKKIVAAAGNQDREYIRSIAVANALDLVRRYLEAMPAVMAGGELLSEPPPPPVAAIPEAPRKKRSRPRIAAILPWKGDGKAEVFRKCGVLLAIVLLLTAAVLAAYTFWLEPNINRNTYHGIQNEYWNSSGTSLPEGAPEGMLTQFSTLYSRNSDVRGWVRIEGTGIDYPVVQSQNGSVDYSTHNFDRQYSLYGVPYFDERNAFFTAQSVNRSLVIYGNNTGNGQMFSNLTEYSSLAYLQQHPLIEMNTIYRNAKWKIFAVLYVGDPMVNQFDFTRTDFEDETDFLEFGYELQKRSLFTVPEDQVDLYDGDSLLLLTTDATRVAGFDGARIVVAARMLRSGESETTDYSGAMENDRVLMPQEWTDQQTPETLPGRTESATAVASVPTQPGEATSPPDESTPQTDSTASGESTGSGTESGAQSPTSTSSSASSQTTPPTSPESSAPTTGKPTTSATTTVPTTSTTTAPPTSRPTEPEPTQPEPGPIPDKPSVTLVDGSFPEADFMAFFRLKDTNTGTVYLPTTKEELQDAVARVVYYEMNRSQFFGKDGTNTEAFKAQAIASYTYILHYCSGGNTYPLALRSAFDKNSGVGKKIYDAVGEVLGYKMLDTSYTSRNDIKKMPIDSMYSAMNCGVSSSSQYTFVSALPYLQSVSSPYDTEENILEFSGGSDHLISTTKVKFSDLKNQLEKNLKSKVTFSGTGPYDSPMYPVKWDGGEGRYVQEINAVCNGRPVKGKAIRDACNNLGIKMRSHSFQIIDYDPETDMITMEVYGNGHGVGMSQYGAVGFAIKGGWNYAQILAHYYSLTPGSKYKLVKPVW